MCKIERPLLDGLQVEAIERSRTQLGRNSFFYGFSIEQSTGIYEKEGCSWSGGVGRRWS